MLKSRRVMILVALGVVFPVPSLTLHAQTLQFAWPDGASAEVRSRSEGRRVPNGGRARTWDMSCDFRMRVRRAGDRLVVSRDGFSGWKGTFPPSWGGGAERFINMIPTFIVSGAGEFLGIEGHETARKLMADSVEQSGGLEPETRSAFETISSNAALEAMARDHWSTLARIWQGVELDPNAPNETQNVTSASPFGGERIRIIAAVKFVKETDCAPGRAGRRCAHFRAESGADKEQVAKIVQSLLREAGADRPVVTAWDQRVRADIVIDKATTLPQQFTLTRFHALSAKVHGREEGGWEEITTTYTFAWRLPNEERK